MWYLYFEKFRILMRKKSRLGYFLLVKKHRWIGYKTLFRRHVDIAIFSRELHSCRFYQKELQYLRTKLSAQLSPSKAPSTMQIEGYEETFQEIVRARLLMMNPGISIYQLEEARREFVSYFSKEEYVPNDNEARDGYTIEEIGILASIAQKNGGFISNNQFIKTLSLIKENRSRGEDI
jgi:hypothetical protein